MAAIGRPSLLRLLIALCMTIGVVFAIMFLPRLTAAESKVPSVALLKVIFFFPIEKTTFSTLTTLVLSLIPGPVILLPIKEESKFSTTIVWAPVTYGSAILKLGFHEMGLVVCRPEVRVKVPPSRIPSGIVNCQISLTESTPSRSWVTITSALRTPAGLKFTLEPASCVPVAGFLRVTS